MLVFFFKSATIALGINNALTNDNITAPIPNPKTFQNDAYLHQRINLVFSM